MSDEQRLDEAAMADRLAAVRPFPAAGWRGDVWRSLQSRGVPPGRPPRLGTLIGVFGAAGAALLAVAALAL